MPIRSKGECEKDNRDIFGLLRDGVIAGNARYWDTHQSDAHIHRPNTRASLIRDLISYELKDRLEGERRRRKINIYEKNQTTYFCLGRNWVMMIHKIYEGGTIALNKTQLCMALNGNAAIQLELPYVPDRATILHLGYVENIADRSEPQVMLVCPRGDEPAWVIELKRDEPPTPAEITPSEPHEAPPKRVRILKDKARKHGK